MEHERIKQKDKEEKDAQDQRNWRISFYGDQAKLLKAEADAVNPQKVRREKYETQLDRIRNEWEDREQARTRIQVEMPQKSQFVGIAEDLGIFSVEKNDSNELIVEEFDSNDVHLFDAPPHTAFEQSDIERNDVMSSLKRQEELYDALQTEVIELKHAISRMMDTRDLLEKEQHQINQEVLAIEKDQLGPPRRMPVADEIPSTHLWKQRSNITAQRLRDIDYTLEKAQRRRNDMLEQSNNVAKGIAILKEKLDEKSAVVSEINNAKGNLPMIIGRNISKVPGMGESFANPKEIMNAITHKSKLVTYRTDSETALQLHKDSNKMEREIWLERLQENGTRSDLESVISRITQISERLQRSKVDSMRLNIVDSLKAFLVSGQRLHAVRKKIVGLLPWYKHHDFMLSSGVTKYVTNNVMGAITFENDDEEPDETFANGITLGPEKSGYCTGSIALPKDCLWTISVTITKQGTTEEYLNIDDTDFVSVKIGPSISSLGTVGTFFNKVNPATGTVLYDVKYVFRGNSFSFRFDFSSSSSDPKKHLAVCTGIYEEFEMPDLEMVADPQNFGKTRVLSSYVKMIRLEEANGKLRETRLLEELIAVENSKALEWDSQILTQYLQRFSREYFLRILKAEILLQQENQKIVAKKKEEEAQQLRALLADANLDREALIEQSKKKYMMKKRAFQRRFVDEANDLVGKRLILWDEAENKWRTIIVEECMIKWIENGLIAKIRHMIQEYDDGHEKIGKPFEIDISKYKYFHSPIQELDPDAIAKMKEKKGWMDTIDQLRYDLKKKVDMADKALEKYKKKSLKDLEKAKDRMQTVFDDNIYDKASDIANFSAAKKKIKSMVPTVLLDMRKGLVVIDEKKKRKDQAKEVARERFINEWIDERRKDLQRKFREMDDEVNDDIEDKAALHQQHCHKLQYTAEQEIMRYKNMIRNQYLIIRKVYLEQAKFPKEVFKKVTPISYHCEHLRTKCWGDLYSKGVKCLVCGKELSNMHEEESQRLGYGSGASRVLWEAVNRHREDEENFRFRSNEELQLVEQERVRLEKERRIMQENECFFYDYQDLKVIYEFDHRHAKDIKSHGIFRQGLQWTKEELENFELKERIRQKDKLEAQGLPETLLEDFDPLGKVEDPPPTFRAADERRRAQYSDFLYGIGRLHNFRKKIFAYKMKRFDMLHEREVYSAVLDALHRESYVLEVQLQDLEADLDKSSKLISTFDSMQRLWQQASLITNQAKKDFMKSEMAKVGVWDDVKEAFDKSTFVHDEMKSLLKTKYLIESKKDKLLNIFNFKQSKYKEYLTAFEKKSDLLYALKYVMPGNMVMTKYGQVYVISYREKDDMVLVNLPFGKPLAKAYIFYKDIVEYERSLQKAEEMVMGLEDEQMRQFLYEERVTIRREKRSMLKEEESQRKYYEFVDLNKNQKQEHFLEVNHAVQESYEIAGSRKYNQMQKKTVENMIKKMIEDRKRRRRDYIGPESSRPKAMSFFEIRKQRKAIVAELKTQFVTRQAKEAEAVVDRRILEVRSEWIQTYSFQEMIDSVVRDMIFELCYEAYHEGKHAKGYAERKTGIFIPFPAYMQYNTYNLLSNQWQHRKDELKRKIELNRGEVNKIIAAIEKEKQARAIRSGNTKSLSPPKEAALLDYEVDEFGEKKLISPEEIIRRKEVRRQRKIELSRQQRLCEEMRLEENRCRDFYRWELKENLRERRLMKEEEKAATMIRKQEIRLRKEAEAALSNVGKNKGGTIGSGSIQLNAGVSSELLAKRDLALSYDRRRQELKELTLERRRRAEDQRLMIIEDELSQMLREIDKIERQKKAFTAEFGEDEEEVDDAKEDDDVVPGGVSSKVSKKKSEKISEKATKSDVDYVLSSIEMDLLLTKNPFPIPDWLDIPRGFNDWNLLTQNKYIKMRVMVRHKLQTIEKKAEKERKRLVKMEEKSYKEWDKRYRILEQEAMESELAVMESSEELKDIENKLKDFEENINKVTIFCREKGEEELKIRSELKKLTSVANQREEEYKDANEWLQLCMRRAKNRDKLKRKVVNQCKWIDTDSINGFHQRFATELLRDRIYQTYFRNIVQSIMNRAEIIATERKIYLIQHDLSLNKVKLGNRAMGMNHVLREIRCDEFLRMKRSALNERFFPKNRKNILLQRFRGWQRFYLWNRGNKDAFKLKYEIIKRQLDIDRQFKQQLVNKKSSNYSQSGNNELDSRSNPLYPTLMSRVRERPVQCQHCFIFYIASQTHSLACAYHPAEYKMQCPASCPHPGLTPKCSAHRMRRYGCCNQTSARAPGCSRRHHIPSSSDPVYDLIMEKINKRDEEFLLKLDTEVEIARQEEWPRRAKEVKRSQLLELEDELDAAREVAARYKDLKFI